ncbi:MAG: hypothetical protein ACREIG_09985 [Nitrospiraceae bacterium]
MAPAKPYGEDCFDHGTQSFVVVESPHFVTHLLILVIIPSFSHFLTTPDDTNSSERAVVNAATCGWLDIFWPNDCAIGALLLVACVHALDGRSQTRKNRMPYMLPAGVIDTVLRKRFEEAAVFFLPARCRDPHAKHCRRSLLRNDLSILKNS